MREFVDRNGQSMQLMELRGHNDFEGLLEGSPYGVRILRLHRARQWMGERRGRFVFELDNLAAQVALKDTKTKVLPPVEQWNARVRGAIDWDRKVERLLYLRWFQGEDDPVQRLREILATLDFIALSVEISMDLDD
jgi:hypothetical protein